METLFDDLFAYRVYLEDIYMNETIIIRQLKNKLIELSYPIEDINRILYNFYCHFNINITEEEINNVVINNNRNPLLNLFINSLNDNSQWHNIIPIMINRLNDNIEIPENDVKITLDENEYNKLERINVGEKMEENCSICMEEIEKGNEIIRLPCKHIFHEKCIKSYLLEYNYKCPLCRYDIGNHNIHINE